MPSKIQVDSIVTEQNTAITLSQGATIPSGKIISNSGGMVVDGTLTGTSFIGSGSGLINIATVSRVYAIKILIDPLPDRS